MYNQTENNSLLDEIKITVCSNCKTASCWQGIFMCENAKEAGTVEMSIGELKKLNLENPDYWKNS